jgi:hypothetical protein
VTIVMGSMLDAGASSFRAFGKPHMAASSARKRKSRQGGGRQAVRTDHDSVFVPWSGAAAIVDQERHGPAAMPSVERC